MTATTEIAALDEVLAYRHNGVIRRYCKENHATPGEAEELFREMLKFLYLSARAADEGFGCAITTEIEKLDEMWHTFLLFTRDYSEFCDSHFGVFLDHLPNENEDGEEVVDDDALRARIERQFELVYDVLGEETLVAWYDDCRFAA